MEGPQRPQRPQRPQAQQNQMNNNPFQSVAESQNYGNNFDMMGGQQVAAKRSSPLKIILIILGVIVGLAAVGAGIYFISTGRISSRVVELEAEVANWEEKYEATVRSKNNEIDQLKEAVNEMTVKEVVPTTSLQRVKGKYVQELWLIDGDFIAPNGITIPGTVDSVNDSYILIGQRFTLKPSDRWTMVSKGTTWEFNHPQRIQGKIKAFARKNTDKISDEDMRGIVQNFFLSEEAKYPNLSEINYRKCFIDDNQVGVIGKADFVAFSTNDENINQQIKDGVGSVLDEHAEGLEIPEGFERDSNNMTINVGFIVRGDYALSFIFLYDSAGGSNSQELIDLLLSSCKIGATGSSLKLE